MKKKKYLLIIMIVFALAAASAIWYFLPKIFLSGVEPSDIKSIAVFDGFLMAIQAKALILTMQMKSVIL